ncbi:MAG: transcriptional regulator [Blastopirellula sp.]|nr:MAG: transcriptional regulator [Blastopirellula sp.]
MATTLGTKLKQLRESKGHTLEQLADLADSSKSYIWELENKNPPRPSAEKLSKIAKVLGVTIDYLLGDDDGIAMESAQDAHFYRNYQKMDEKTKEKLRTMAKLLDNEND